MFKQIQHVFFLDSDLYTLVCIHANNKRKMKAL